MAASSYEISRPLEYLLTKRINFMKSMSHEECEVFDRAKQLFNEAGYLEYIEWVMPPTISKLQLPHGTRTIICYVRGPFKRPFASHLSPSFTLSVIRRVKSFTVGD